MLLLSIILVQKAILEACDVTVTPNNINDVINGNITSDSHLIFEPDYYHLEIDFVISNVNNFILNGSNSNLSCIPYVSINVVNVTNFTIKDLNLINCGKKHGINFNGSSYKPISANTSILLCNCALVMVENIIIIIKTGNVGILAVNVKNDSQIFRTSIIMSYTDHPTTSTRNHLPVNGIVLYFTDGAHGEENYISSNFAISKYHYKVTGICSHPLQYAIGLLLFQKHYNTCITIQNTTFSNFTQVSALYYYAVTCGLYVHNILTIENCVISNNNGSLRDQNITNTMFYIMLYNLKCVHYAVIKGYCNQQYSNISFINCMFSNNSYISSMIFIVPANSRAVTGNIQIANSTFSNNTNTHFLNMDSDRDNVWQLTNYIEIRNTTITSNKHSTGKDIISTTNGWIKFIGPIVITQNDIYKNIARLYLTGATFEYNITISDNIARHIFDGSYFLIKANTTIVVSGNTVYAIIKQKIMCSASSNPICPIQFYSERGIGDLNEIGLTFNITIQGNMHMWSKYLPGEKKLFNNCTWLAGTAFYESNFVAKEIFTKILHMAKNRLINETTTRKINMSICPCTSNQTYNCTAPNLGKIFPGQTINVSLIALKQNKTPFTFVVVETKESGCGVVHISQLSQTHLTHNCNDYSYTLWPNNDTITTK